jgi:hypothetical protein
VSTCSLSIVIATKEQVFPSAMAQRIIVKILSSENVKSVQILKRCIAQMSRTQKYDWSKSFKEGRVTFENMQRLHLLQGNL